MRLRRLVRSGSVTQRKCKTEEKGSWEVEGQMVQVMVGSLSLSFLQNSLDRAELP
jgi:hypothetical protein